VGNKEDGSKCIIGQRISGVHFAVKWSVPNRNNNHPPTGFPATGKSASHSRLLFHPAARTPPRLEYLNNSHREC
jgi:hypothetical protein